MGKTVLKWCVLALLLAYVSVMAVWGRTEADRHVCTGITVEIDASRGVADSVAAVGLRSELNKYPRKIVGAHLNTINTLEIERFLSKFNNFESMECMLLPDGKLNVKAVPLIPEIRVFEPGGISYYVNKDGKRIDANAKFFVDVPIVQGRFSRRFPAVSLLPVVRFVNNDPKLKLLISSVKADDPDNILLISRLNGHVINIGDTSRLVEKRQGIMTAYMNILPRKGWQTYDTISVKFRNQIVCTRRDKAERTDYLAEEDYTDMEEATLEGLEEGGTEHLNTAHSPDR